MANILIVDDQPDLAFMVSTCLATDGHYTKTVLTRHELYISLAAFPCELIILDVLLGEDNGREICAALKKSEWQHIPIILYSSLGGLLTEYKSVGASAKLLKPFTLKAITELVKQVLGNVEEPMV
jgi:putative two-component system response regulator